MSLVRSLRTLVALGVVALGLVSTGRADSIDGTMSIAGLGITTNGTSTVGSIATATSFEFSNLLTDTGGGDMTGTPNTLLGPAVLDVGAGTFSFSNVAFGTFVSSLVAETANVPGTRSFYVYGTYTAGTYYPGFDPGAASIVISFAQSGGATGSIGGTLSFSSPPVQNPLVPEPASMAMVGTAALAGLGLVARRRLARA